MANYLHAITGTAKIGGAICFFRSKSESYYARYLQELLDYGKIIKWEYEPQAFSFPVIGGRGVRGYLPDFRVTFADGRVEYHEVKGQMSELDKEKHRLMKICYPDTKLVVIMTDSPLFLKLKRRYYGAPYYRYK